MKDTVETYVKQKYVGRILVGAEFSMEGRGVTVPQKITNARIGNTEGDNDPCVWLTLEDGESVFFYTNEEIYVS